MCLPDYPTHALHVHMPGDKHERPYQHRRANRPAREGIIETLVDMIFANAPCYDSSLLNEAIRASWRFHDDL
jgi:hypothetical protein